MEEKKLKEFMKVKWKFSRWCTWLLIIVFLNVGKKIVSLALRVVWFIRILLGQEKVWLLIFDDK